MPIQELEEAVNEVSDRDWSWWPFVWLRPEQHADLSLARVVALSALYGVPCSVLCAFGVHVARQASNDELVLAVLAFPLLFLFAGSVLVAPMWNRRAERLRRQRDRLDGF